MKELLKSDSICQSYAQMKKGQVFFWLTLYKYKRWWKYVRKRSNVYNILVKPMHFLLLIWTPLQKNKSRKSAARGTADTLAQKFAHFLFNSQYTGLPLQSYGYKRLRYFRDLTFDLSRSTISSAVAQRGRAMLYVCL